jgi:hypothetical protein
VQEDLINSEALGLRHLEVDVVYPVTPPSTATLQRVPPTEPLNKIPTPRSEVQSKLFV